MKINNLDNQKLKASSKKISKKYDGLQNLILALNKRNLPEDIVIQVNEKIKIINSSIASSSKFLSLLRKTHTNILGLLEKELKLVPKHFYRDRWMAIGMSVFGVPIGVAMGSALGNMAFIGVGIPIGMAIGIGLGTAKDKAAEEAGLQLDI